MKKTRVKMNKPLCLGISILDISKTLIYKFWYDYFKPKFHTLSSGEIRKYEYLTGEDIWPYNQKQITVQTKSTYSSLGKAFEKQIKTIEDQDKKQVKALENLKPKEETRRIEDKANNNNNK